MKILGKDGLGRVLKIFLQVCFYGGIVLLIILPFALRKVGLHLNATAVVIYPNGIVLLVIMHEFIGQFNSLKENNPFCMENVKRLKHAGIASLIEALLWAIDLGYELILVKITEPLFIIVLIFLCVLFIGVAIALYILSELIKQATEYKLENDLTI